MKDVYKQNVTLSIKYLSNDKQITGEDVTPIRKKIVDTIQKKWGGIIVEIFNSPVQRVKWREEKPST